MINDFFKWLCKTTFIAVIWVFVFSINIKGKTIFSHSNEVLVQNQFVSMLDEELGRLWFKISETARLTFRSVSGQDEEKKG